MKPPKQQITCRNKTYKQPTTNIPPSAAQRTKAFTNGYNAWKVYTKSIADNPHQKGALHDEWRRGYLQASNTKPSNITQLYPEGRQQRPNSQVVIKRHRRKKFKVKDTASKPVKEQPFNYYLGFVKQKKFRAWTRNPPLPKQKEQS